MLVGNHIPLYLIEFLAAALNERNELSPQYVSACIATNELEKRDEDASRHMPFSSEKWCARIVLCLPGQAVADEPVSKSPRLSSLLQPILCAMFALRVLPFTFSVEGGTTAPFR